MDLLRLILLCFATCLIINPSVQGIGINYGLLGDNLPPPQQVIAVLQSRNIHTIRIFEPNADVLSALHGSNIEVIVGVKDEDLQQLATDPNFAATWVNTNVIPHIQSVKFRCITAGNEVIPGPFAGYVLGTMQNLDAALEAAGLSVPLSTTVSMSVLGTSYPPSMGEFSASAAVFMVPILGFLRDKGYPLLANVYPYYAYVSDPINIRLDYALISTSDAIVTDGNFQYNNLLDAMVDAVHAAMDKAGGSSVSLVLGETGWPSGGDGGAANIANAQAYNNNLVRHLSFGLGTPRRPGNALETYLFALFNEDLKPAGVEQNWGLYYPDLTEVYHVDF